MVGAAAVMIVAGVGCEPTPIDEGNVPPGRNAARAVEVSGAGDALVHGWGEPVPGEGAGGPESAYLLSAEGEWSEPWLDDPVLDVVDGWFSDRNDAGAVLGGVTYRPIPGQPGVAGAGAVWDPVTGLRTLPLYTLWFQPTAIAPADIADDGTVIGNVSVPFIGDTTLHRGLVLDATTFPTSAEAGAGSPPDGTAPSDPSTAMSVTTTDVPSTASRP